MRGSKTVTKSAPFQLAARLGLVAYGVVHLLVAWLALQVAYGDLDGGGVDKADKTGALQSMSANPGGDVLLWLIAIGLGVTTLWQLVEAWTSKRGAWHRAMNVGEAILFGYLSFTAGKLAAGSPSSSTDQAQVGLISSLLGESWGKPVVIVIGVAIVAAGLFLARHGLTHDFAEELDLSRVTARTRRVAVRFGRVGFVALGAVYGLGGVLVVMAAAQADPAKATGLDIALKTLAAQPYGAAYLTAIALGLTAFAAFTLFDARYRKP
jgi:Domain of Unknown Function (DUF1206)